MREIPGGLDRLRPGRTKDVKTLSSSAQRPLKESGLAAESSGNIGKHYRLEVGEILELRSSRVASIGAHGGQSRGIKINPRLSLRDQPESQKTRPARRRWRHNNSTNDAAGSASETLSGVQELKS